MDARTGLTCADYFAFALQQIRIFTITKKGWFQEAMKRWDWFCIFSSSIVIAYSNLVQLLSVPEVASLNLIINDLDAWSYIESLPISTGVERRNGYRHHEPLVRHQLSSVCLHQLQNLFRKEWPSHPSID